MSPDDLPPLAFSEGDDLPSIVGRIASKTPGATAFVHGEETLSWEALDRRMTRVAGALLRASVRRGDRVAVLAYNSLAYVVAFYGALRAGASVVPLPTMATEPSLRLMLEDSGATVVFADRAHLGLVAGITAGRALLRVGLDFGGDGFASMARLEEEEDAAKPPPLPRLRASDAFDVIYSSGTTGVPKGIVHTHGARKASYAGSRAAYFSPDAINVVATPFYSNTTCITWFLTTAAGGTSVVLGKFSPEAFIEATRLHRATHAMLVPVQYDRILSSPAYSREALATLRFLFSTSAPLRATVKRRVLDELRAELVEIYGLTEGGPVTVLEARRHPDKLASVGTAAAGTELRIVDEQGEDVPQGQTGEVAGRSANMMSGYLNRPEDTRAIELRDRQGKLYFKTGDLGRLDADGFLYLLDRKKDVIISGGFNVYATDLEVVLAAHPDVAEVAVIGVPSERWGETPLALVVLRPGATATADGLRDHVNERVGKAQRVSAVELRDELPKSAIGKVLKRELRAPYWKD